MYGFHAQLEGQISVGASHEHPECACVTVTMADETGKVALTVDTAEALESLGWELLKAAEAMKATAGHYHENGAVA